MTSTTQKLEELAFQAIKEKSHYYVRSTCLEAINLIKILHREIDQLGVRVAVAERLARDLAHALSLRKMHDDDCMDATEKFQPHEMCECGASVAQQLLETLPDWILK